MRVDFDEAGKVQKQFVEQYKSLRPTIGVTSLSRIKEWGGTFKLKKGESLEDKCLVVTVREPSDERLILPSEYKGVRVFYGGVTPEIIPADKSEGYIGGWFAENRG